MNFDLSPEICKLRDRTRGFIAEQVIPLENDERQSSHGPSEALRQELVSRARRWPADAACVAGNGRISTQQQTK